MRVPTPLSPDRWPVVPAKFLFQRARRQPRDRDGVVTAFRDGEVTLRSNRRTDGFTNAIQEHGYQGVRHGDLVIHSMDGFAGAIGVSDSDGKASPVVHCYTPAPGVDSRFYAYLLRWLARCDFITSLAKGIRERSTAFDPEAFRSLLMPAPPAYEQRAIADFLDTETARIDALITKKRRMIDLFDERRWISFLARVEDTGLPGVPVRRALTFITDGPFGSAFTSDEYTDDGVSVIRLGNIGFAEFRDTELAHLPPGRFAEFSRHQVRHGDLLFAGLGDERNHAGRACVAPDLGEAIVKGKCFCARLDPTRADADYVAMYFSSPVGAEAVAVEARGSTRSMINLEIVKSILLPLPSVDLQRSIAAQTRREWRIVSKLRSDLERQIELLQQHRLALITAAVTGELEIPGVAA